VPVLAGEHRSLPLPALTWADVARRPASRVIRGSITHFSPLWATSAHSRGAQAPRQWPCGAVSTPGAEVRSDHAGHVGRECRVRPVTCGLTGDMSGPSAAGRPDAAA